MLTSYTNNILLTLGFALGIVKVQYRLSICFCLVTVCLLVSQVFIGTAAKRSPEKLDLFLIFHHGRGNAQMIK